MKRRPLAIFAAMMALAFAMSPEAFCAGGSRYIRHTYAPWEP